jgi:hypothetical protein
MKQYKIIFRGHFVAQENQERIKNRLLKLYNNNNAIVEQFFSRKTITLKAGLSETEAKKYAHTFHRIGVICDLLIDNSKTSEFSENAETIASNNVNKKSFTIKKYIKLNCCLLAMSVSILVFVLLLTSLYFSQIFPLRETLETDPSKLVFYTDKNKTLHFQILNINGRYYSATMKLIAQDPLTFQALNFQYINNHENINNKGLAYFNNNKITIPIVTLNPTKEKFHVILQQNENFKFSLISAEKIK